MYWNLQNRLFKKRKTCPLVGQLAKAHIIQGFPRFLECLGAMQPLSAIGVGKFKGFLLKIMQFHIILDLALLL